MNEPLVVGAVAYTSNVVTIWEGLRDYFAASPAPMDFVLFSNYASQVRALLDGTIDVAWNTNLAWVRTVGRTEGACRALAMRDTDAVFQSLFVARPGSGLAGLADLNGRRLALGSRDSAQAAILPVHYLSEAGLDVRDVELLRNDSDVGKHGDTGRSELDALRAVLDDRADAAVVGGNTWEAIGRERLMPGAFEVFWESPTYSHCNFTALPHVGEERTRPWVEWLFAMDWDNPDHRPILELEGLRRWIPPRLEGYESLFAAVRAQGVPQWW
ncbi:ABC-type phosphate/phosphonate transport system substrate-binding protein [Saccharomonospora amisosensis]|uniref:ABC-type phosphate/phosphonate transport system substrate-binding protein n=1 Tax=Saccharomonospora amisosensis TaxID=1128677 RepID=A0A7X5ZR59_9PSEU|nr:PhnD/SsuA/transferrin family substrate-binding protein [Saccharomonospora amisosensis]NIJ12492.1 ABC-type phosphate/phosphonate transport system substrate-binding protein [Saccharomonospora amisosensis]